MKNDKHGELSQIKPAGAWARAWASVIDTLIISTPMLLVGIFNYYKSGQLTLINQDILWIIFSTTLGLTYNIYLTVTKGATWGKNIFGLRVVKFKTTQYVNYKTAIIREFVKMMPGISFIPIVGSIASSIISLISVLLVLFTKEKRTVHDRIAGTQVIKVSNSWPMGKIILLLLPFAFLLFSVKSNITYYTGDQRYNVKRVSYPILDFILQAFGKPNPNTSIPPEVEKERKKMAQIAQENNKRRRSDVNLILNAISQYRVDHNGNIPNVITSTEELEINKDRADLCSFLVPTYLSALPNDPQVRNRPPVEDCTTSYSTGYSIFQDPFTNKVIVKAPGTELQEEKIQATR